MADLPSQPYNSSPAPSAPTHRKCGVCSESLPRHLFSKKEYLKHLPSLNTNSHDTSTSNLLPTCQVCKRKQTAHRLKQKPPQPPKQGRVADSGLIRRPNNFGYCNYIDMLFGMKCFEDIVRLGAFGSAKDVSESMAVIHAATKHGRFSCGGEMRRADVLCLCIGDGCTPRTAVLASFMKKWTCISIDPALSEEWQGQNPKKVHGLTGYGVTLAEFMSSSADKQPHRHLLLICAHSHARFVGPASIELIRLRYGNIPTTVVSLPCCPKFRHKGDIGRDPDVFYEDDCVFSACRKVEIWHYAGGTTSADDDALFCSEVANPNNGASSLSALLQSPSDLTSSIVAEMLQSCPIYSECFHHNEGRNADVVQSISVSDVEEGVLSHVVNVSIEYSSSAHSQSLPSGIIIKFLRPESPQKRMFATEGNFYSPRNAVLRSKIPFGVPAAIYTSPECIALQRIDGAVKMKLVNGCTSQQDAENCVRLLATMHAQCWIGMDVPTTEKREASYADLDPTPGVGLAMDGLTKERLFTARWEEYLDLYASTKSRENVIADEDEQVQLRSLCAKLSRYRLREMHEKVTTFQPTLIHGDFHVANLLFVKEAMAKASPILVDWATCGRGNPLFDLCFFLVVSTPRGGEDEDYTYRLLHLYYTTLVDDKTSTNVQSISKTFPTFDGAFLRMYRDCIVNEFLILVAYDRLARHFVQAADTLVKREERAHHFHNVARRCMIALRTMQRHITLPMVKSEQDCREEAEALENGDNLSAEL